MRVNSGDVIARVIRRIYKDTQDEKNLIDYETFFMNKTTGDMAVGKVDDGGNLVIKDTPYDPKTTYAVGVNSIL